MNLDRFSVATFNLFNLQLPGQQMNPGQRPWTQAEFDRKLAGSAGSSRARRRHRRACRSAGTPMRSRRSSTDAGLDATYDMLAEPADGRQIVCGGARPQGPAARRAGVDRRVPRRHPAGVENDPLDPQAPESASHRPAFSRPVLNFQVALRDDPPPTEVFVTHLKSKLPTRIDQEPWFDADPDLTSRTRPRSAPRCRRSGARPRRRRCGCC